MAIVLVACSLGACASRGPVAPAPFPRPGTTAPEGEVPGYRGTGEAVAQTALSLVGTPYRWGGGDEHGVDCSGLVQYVFRQHGAQVPRRVVDQYRTGRRADVRHVRAGDLLFFATTARGASHVAISLGGRRFVHAPSSGGVVRVETLDVGYWASRLVGVRRLVSK